MFCDTTSSAPAGRGQCRCPTGYRPRYDQLACVGRRLAEPCRVNPDCQASSTAGVACVGGRCACVAGHVAVSFRTCRLRRLGDLCAVSAAQYFSYFSIRFCCRENRESIECHIQRLCHSTWTSGYCNLFNKLHLRLHQSSVLLKYSTSKPITVVMVTDQTPSLPDKIPKS